MTYNVFGGMLNLAQSITTKAWGESLNLRFRDSVK